MHSSFVKQYNISWILFLSPAIPYISSGYIVSNRPTTYVSKLHSSTPICCWHFMLVTLQPSSFFAFLSHNASDSFRFAPSFPHIHLSKCHCTEQCTGSDLRGHILVSANHEAFTPFRANILVQILQTGRKSPYWYKICTFCIWNQCNVPLL